MKPGLIACNIFMLACIATFWLSAALLGFGMWGWIILAAGVLVGISPWFPSMRAHARTVALILVILSCIALPLILLAANIGGTASFSNSETLLLLGFGAILVSGIAVTRATKRKPAGA